MHKSFSNDYGVTHLLVFHDEKGNIYSSYYSGAGHIPCEDDNLVLTGTVKKHNLFNEIKQTVLTRIKMDLFCPDHKEELVNYDFCMANKCENPCIYCPC